jgi:hypothetical protein
MRLHSPVLQALNSAMRDFQFKHQETLRVHLRDLAHKGLQIPPMQSTIAYHHYKQWS